MDTLTLANPRAPNNIIVISSAIAAAAGLSLGAYRAYADYRAFVALGPNGLPDNFGGWLIQLAMRPFSRTDVTAPAPWRDEDLPSPAYDDVVGVRSSYFLGQGVLPLAVREGWGAGEEEEQWTTTCKGRREWGGERVATKTRTGRPKMTTVVAPHRQLSQQQRATIAGDGDDDESPPPPLLSRMDAFVVALAARNPSLFELGTSGLERHGTALFVREEVYSHASSSSSDTNGKHDESKSTSTAVSVHHHLPGTNREFAHIHHGDGGSTHLVLSLADSALAIAQLWAERHRLSGKMIPWGYVLVYIPRDEGELAVWREMMLASARFVVGDTKGVLVAAPEV